jgi:hypothetical protein
MPGKDFLLRRATTDYWKSLVKSAKERVPTRSLLDPERPARFRANMHEEIVYILIRKTVKTRHAALNQRTALDHRTQTLFQKRDFRFA